MVNKISKVEIDGQVYELKDASLSGVHIGDGDMPENCNLQILSNGLLRYKDQNEEIHEINLIMSPLTIQYTKGNSKQYDGSAINLITIPTYYTGTYQPNILNNGINAGNYNCSSYIQRNGSYTIMGNQMLVSMHICLKMVPPLDFATSDNFYIGVELPSIAHLGFEYENKDSIFSVSMHSGCFQEHGSAIHWGADNYVTIYSSTTINSKALTLNSAQETVNYLSIVGWVPIKTVNGGNNNE